MLFAAKCFKELSDVRSMSRMTPQERKAESKQGYFQGFFFSCSAGDVGHGGAGEGDEVGRRNLDLKAADSGAYVDRVE